MDINFYFNKFQYTVQRHWDFCCCLFCFVFHFVVSPWFTDYLQIIFIYLSWHSRLLSSRFLFLLIFVFTSSASINSHSAFYNFCFLTEDHQMPSLFWHKYSQSLNLCMLNLCLSLFLIPNFHVNMAAPPKVLVIIVFNQCSLMSDIWRMLFTL